MKILLIVLLGLTAGCQLLNRQDVKEKEEQKRLKDQVSSIQRSRADTDVRFKDIAEEVRVVSGKIETVEYNQKKNQETTRRDVAFLRQLIDKQNEKITALEEHMRQMEKRLLAALKTPPKTPKKKKKSKGSGDLYGEADKLFKNKNFKRAIVKYEDYRKKYPKGKKVAEATYRIGLCFDELSLNKDAKAFYQEAIDRFPKSKSAKKAKFRLSNLK